MDRGAAIRDVEMIAWQAETAQGRTYRTAPASSTQPGESLKLNVTLDAGNVTADVPLPESRSAGASQRIEAKTIEDMPRAGRRSAQFDIYSCQDVPIVAHWFLIDRSKKLPAFFYETATGNQPVREWILALSTEDRKVVGRDIQKVEFGWPLGLPYCRSLGNGLWEVRSDLTDGKIARVIFLATGGRMVLLLGFIKKTRKTPVPDLNLALRRMKEVI